MNHPPEIEARFVPALHPHRGDAIGSLVFDCTACGREHSHGAGIVPGRPLYGHRTSHCPAWPDGYVLVPAKATK